MKTLTATPRARTAAPRARNVAPRLLAVFVAMRALQDAIEEFEADETVATAETLAALAVANGRNISAEDLDQFACETIEQCAAIGQTLKNAQLSMAADFRAWTPFTRLFGEW